MVSPQQNGKLLDVLLLLGKSPHTTQKKLWRVIITIRYDCSFLNESHKEKFWFKCTIPLVFPSLGANSSLRIILLTLWNLDWQLAHKIADAVAVCGADTFKLNLE